ncbi:MAG: hypothetical protein Q7J10_04115 [Methanosarcinaceae archaeon]|nr:hypothetical protein [Methanosarcinaceae archaeon]
MENKLQIEFIFEIKKKFTFKNFKFPIQNHPFKYGLRIKNIGNNVFSGATLKNIQMPSDKCNLNYTLDKEFSLHFLNPNDSAEIWFEQMTTYITGLIWIKVDLVPNNIDDFITTYQKDKHSEQANDYGKKNKWGDVFFIQGENELQQARTNSYILILTALTFLQGAFGIDKIMLTLFKIFQRLLLYVADMIGKIL